MERPYHFYSPFFIFLFLQTQPTGRVIVRVSEGYEARELLRYLSFPFLGLLLGAAFAVLMALRRVAALVAFKAVEIVHCVVSRATLDVGSEAMVVSCEASELHL